MSSQRPIDPDADGFSFVDAEHHILEFWQSQDIFQKSLQDRDSRKETDRQHESHSLRSRAQR